MWASNRGLTEHVNQPLSKAPIRLLSCLSFSSSFKYDRVYMHLLLYEERSVLGRICLQLDCRVSLSAYLWQENCGTHGLTHKHTHTPFLLFVPKSIFLTQSCNAGSQNIRIFRWVHWFITCPEAESSPCLFCPRFNLRLHVAFSLRL